MSGRSAVSSRRAPLVCLLVIAVALGAVCTFVARAHADVLTNSSDNARDGWYNNQPGLDPSVVGGSTFGQLASLNVTGQVYAQPVISGSTLVVGTEHDMVYGFDTQSRQQKWSLSLGTPVAPLGSSGTQAGCTDISPELGITSTPVVDPATNTVYVVGSVVPSGGGPTDANYYMHALDVATGAERVGWPVQITGSAANDPTASFTGKYELQRPGLLLMNGVVYAAFSGHCDAKPYRGYIAGVSTSGAAMTTLWTSEAAPDAQAADGPGGGIWMSGAGLMSDRSGDIVFTTGNGTAPATGPASPAAGALGQAQVRLRVQPDGTLKLVDYFAPYDAAALNTNDSDVGSGGVIALPPQFGTPSHPHLLASMGKQGTLWVTDADDLGGVGQGVNGGDDVVARLALNSGGLRGRPAAWGGDGGYMYLASSQGGGGTGRLYAFKYGVDGSGNPTFAQVARTSDLFGFGSGSPVVTSDGTTSGSALVWDVWFPSAPPSGQPIGTGAQLRAYSAVPVNGSMNLVYSAPIAVGTKFTTPAVDNGKLYLGTQDGHVLVFGTPVSAPLSGGTLSFPATTVGQTSTATETVTANSDVTIQSVGVTGPGFSITTTSPALPAVVATGRTAAITVNFTPTGAGTAAGVLTVNTSAGAVTFSISGDGQASGPKLAQDPCCLAFGGIPVGSTTNGTVLFSNTGAGPLVINGYDMPTGPFTVSGLPPAGSTLAPGASFVATFSFDPTTSGIFSSSLILHTNDPTALGFDGPNESAAPGAVALSGSAGTQSVMRLTPQTVNFGTVPVGTTATQTFTVTNVGGTNLNINISKTPGGAFTAVSNLPEGSVISPGASVTETVSFTPAATGATSSSWAITGDDGTGRQDVSFTGTGSSPANPTVNVGDVDVQRPTSGSTVVNVPVTLSRASTSTVSMSYSTKDGSATAVAGDYLATTGTLIFNPGETSKTIPVTVNGAPPTSSPATFTATVGSLKGVVSADASGKVYLIGTALPTSISVSDASAAAMTDGTAATLTYTLTASPAPAAGKTVTVKVATADGSAVAASGDYTPVSTTVNFSAAAPVQTITVPVRTMPVAGATKTVLLNVSGVSSGSNIADTSALGTVYSTTPPVPGIYVGDTQLVRPTSGTANATFTVTLSRPVTTTVPFSYAAAPSTGTTPADFTPTAGTAAFAPGQTSLAIAVPVNGSAVASGTSSLVLNVSKQSGATLADPAGKAYLVSPVTHDFVSVLPAATWVSPSVDGSVAVPVVLASASPRTVSVTASTTDGSAVAGTDYATTSAKLTFAPGSTVQYLVVPVPRQATAPPNRTFSVKLGGDSGVTELSSSSATVTLVEHTAGATVPPTPTAPTFTATALPTTAAVGTPYTYTVVAGGSPTPGYSLASGALPTGLGLNAVTGVISGTPTVGGTYTFVLDASNGVGTDATTPPITVTVTGGGGG